MYDEFITLESDFNGINYLYNMTKKTYSDGSIKIKKCSFDTIKGLSRKNRHTGTMSEEELDQKLKDRIKKRREEVSDLALNNSNWEYFLTLTFDPKNKDYFPDGYSHERAIELLTKWINNQKHQNKNMTYLLVSEFHKESGNLHFHGLFTNVPKWKLSAGINPHTGEFIFLDGVQIFNLDNFNFGWNTVSYIQDQERVSHYLSKYITKEIVNIKNKKTYWYSRNLVKPKITYHHISTDLKEYLEDRDDVSYYNCFSSKDKSIEIAKCQRQHNSKDINLSTSHKEP